ncbi:hypothetical protein BD410DRAFT_786284 [Rickenella mellea]|uniref:MYND-type domain-containing protein n=1 Tax=Rickenella mellea TaxID=50990 RepID=A0A4Y7QAS8_9AGAM|nr:hypothetical protein BD410DRAFT_786284 [Rickenella mellea]
MEMQAKTFNDHVDEYIRKGTDMRRKLDIERAAKIRSSGGAMFKVCKAEQCNLQEGGNTGSFKCCGKCKLAFYCSLGCQRAHWRDHKIICGSADQTEQTLPSQQTLEMHILNPLLESTDENVKQYCNAMKVGLNSRVAASLGCGLNISGESGAISS